MITNEQMDEMVCLAHPTSTDEDCEFCKKAMAWLGDKYEAQIAENNSKAQYLAMHGVGVSDGMAMDLKLDLLLQLVFKSNEYGRLRFECLYANQIADKLSELTSHVNKMKLAATPGLITP